MEYFIHSAIALVGMGAILFLSAFCISAGLHVGLRIGALLFGPIKATVIQRQNREGDA